MTAFVANVSETLTTSDTSGRGVFHGVTTDIESVSTSDTLARQVGVSRASTESSVPTFFPSVITSGTLLAWYQADKLALTDGSAVSAWPDVSGNGFAATQGTGASQPTFHVNQQNGLPAIVFDGVNDCLTTTVPTTAQPFTIFTIANATGQPTNRGVWGGTFGSNSLLTNFSTLELNSLASSGSAAPAGWHNMTALVNGGSSLLRVDGTQVASGAAGSSSLLAFVIGEGAPGPFAPWSSGIGELLIYTGALSPADVLVVEAYLSQKWLTPNLAGVQTVTTAQSYVRQPNESLITSDTPIKATGYMRTLSESFTTITDLVAYTVAHVPVTITQTLTTTDAVVRQARFPRQAIESLTLADATSRATGYHRAASEALHISVSDVVGISKLQFSSATEHLATSDAVIRVANFQRQPTETLSTSDVISRILGHIRQGAESISTSDALSRLWVAQRINVESWPTQDQVSRATTVSRPHTESLTTVDVLTWLHNAPRQIVEHLTTSDAITHIQMFLPIMGYIYYNPIDGTVQSSLPDWGFILIEDPANGVALNFAPIPANTLSFAREK